MRRILLLLAAAPLAAIPAGAAPPVPGLAEAARSAAPRAQLVWWHAGGMTPDGTRWHAGGADGYRWGGAYHAGGVYHPPTYYHGYGDVHYGGYYRPPVAATPWVHPAGTFAAGAVVGATAAAGAAAASTAAASAARYSQPPTVVNNYYYNPG